MKKGLFGNCREYKTVVEYYDLTDKDTRLKLKNMGFVAKVEKADLK